MQVEAPVILPTNAHLQFLFTILDKKYAYYTWETIDKVEYKIDGKTEEYENTRVDGKVLLLTEEEWKKRAGKQYMQIGVEAWHILGDAPGYDNNNVDMLMDNEKFMKAMGVSDISKGIVLPNDIKQKIWDMIKIGKVTPILGIYIGIQGGQISTDSINASYGITALLNYENAHNPKFSVSDILIA
jgi:hypothetical protein